MAGFTRRSKPLKAAVDFDEITSVSITNPADGDLLVYESSTGLWENKKALTGNYALTGLLTADDVTIGDALVVGGNSNLAGDLAVVGALTAGSLTVGSVNIASLAVSGNTTLSGTLSVAGSLTGAGFSFSGTGSVADLTVTDDLSVGDTLLVSGVATFSSSLFAGNLYAAEGSFSSSVSIAGGLSVTGSIAASFIASAGDLTATGDVYVYGDDLYVAESLRITDLSTDLLLLELNAASITEGTGDPNGTVAAYPGSLRLRTDGYADRTLYYKIRGEGTTDGWIPVVDHRADIEWLMFLVMQHHQALANQGLVVPITV